MTADNRVRFTFRMPLKLMKAVEKEAKNNGFTKNAMLLEILKNWQSKTK